jgi:Patatin-like phospholipase
MFAKSRFQYAQQACLARDRGAFRPNAQYLSLSGGGDKGAFGAGLLVGWTAHGDRPKFKLVTGVSTGALTAPFAFLGPEYDAALTDVYTNIDPSKVFKKRFLPLAALMQDAMADTSPLFGTISHYINEEMLAKIAAEYENSRPPISMPVCQSCGTSERSPQAAIQARLISSVESCLRPHPYQRRSHRCCSTSLLMANPIRKCMSMAALSAKRFLFRPVSTCALHKKSPGSAERPTSLIPFAIPA